LADMLETWMWLQIGTVILCENLACEFSVIRLMSLVNLA